MHIFIDSTNLNKTVFPLAIDSLSSLSSDCKTYVPKDSPVKSQKQICWTFFCSLFSAFKFIYSKVEVAVREKTLFAVMRNFVVLAISREIEGVAQKEITRICKVREESNKFIIFLPFSIV